MGTAAARELAIRGRDVTLLERFDIGHANGSSHGATRIFRLAYFHPDYVRMARLALDEWRELEDAAGERLLTTTGGIDLGPGAELAAGSLEAAGVPFAWLTAEAVRERWPDVRMGSGERALFQDSAGVVAADRTVRALARAAREAGATIRERTQVEALIPVGDAIEVRSQAGVMRASTAIVAAGAWAGPLLQGAGLHLPLGVTQEQVSYFARARGDSPLPTLIEWMEPPTPHRYLVPDPGQPWSVKLGEHGAGGKVTAETRTFDADPGGVERVRAWSLERCTGLSGTARHETCLYTNTPDEDFVLDRVGPVVIASACSGHGFKFTPLVGRLVADLATGTAPPLPLERFSCVRPSLGV